MTHHALGLACALAILTAACATTPVRVLSELPSGWQEGPRANAVRSYWKGVAVQGRWSPEAGEHAAVVDLYWTAVEANSRAFDVTVPQVSLMLAESLVAANDVVAACCVLAAAMTDVARMRQLLAAHQLQYEKDEDEAHAAAVELAVAYFDALALETLIHDLSSSARSREPGAQPSAQRAETRITSSPICNVATRFLVAFKGPRLAATAPVATVARSMEALNGTAMRPDASGASIPKGWFQGDPLAREGGFCAIVPQLTLAERGAVIQRLDQEEGERERQQAELRETTHAQDRNLPQHRRRSGGAAAKSKEVLEPALFARLALGDERAIDPAGDALRELLRERTTWEAIGGSFFGINARNENEKWTRITRLLPVLGCLCNGVEPAVLQKLRDEKVRLDPGQQITWPALAGVYAIHGLTARSLLCANLARRNSQPWIARARVPVEVSSGSRSEGATAATPQ